MNDRKLTGSIFIDLSEAFGTLSHAQILENLSTKGFARVVTWLEENQLIVNLRKAKTECILFGRSQRTKNKTLDVLHLHRTLSETNSYKYLGVQSDQNLNIKDHTTQTYKKV